MKHCDAQGGARLDADPPSKAEKAFIALQADPQAYAAWATKVRADWERDNVLWMHGFRDGKAVWKQGRPPAE